MEKYLIILIILIVLYYIHKHCIQSEIENILINKKNNIYKTVQQEQALLEIQSKVKESMKAINTLITQVKDNPEIKKKLITKNIENFTDTIGVGTDTIGPPINEGYPNNILYSPEIEEIIQKFRILVYTVSKLPQTNQTIDAFYNLGREVIALSESQVLVNDLRALVAKVKVHLPNSLNSISQGLTQQVQQVIYILDRLLTQINELLVNLSTSLPISLLQTQKQTQRQVEDEAQRQIEAEAQIQVEAQRQAEAEIKRQAEAEIKRQAEAEIKRQAEAEIKRQTEAEIKRQTEAEIKRQAEAEIKRQTEVEAQRQAEVKRQAEVEAQRQTEVKRQAEVEAQRQAEIQRQVEIQNSYHDESYRNNDREYFMNTPKIDYFWKGKQTQSSICGGWYI
jgi:hypothetical protein